MDTCLMFCIIVYIDYFLSSSHDNRVILRGFQCILLEQKKTVTVQHAVH